MTFSQAISNGFNKFFNATGRASRSEFWWWYLFIFLISIAIGFIIGLISVHNAYDASVESAIGRLIELPFVISLICAAIRRLHDIGKSGWNYCWAFLPIIGTIYLIILWCRASEPEENEYGENPLDQYNT